MNNHDYEIEIEYLGQDYMVYADLYAEGYYEVVEQSFDDPGGFDVIYQPVFCNYLIIDPDTGLEVLPEHSGEIMLISENVFRNIYWDKELNF